MFEIGDVKFTPEDFFKFASFVKDIDFFDITYYSPLIAFSNGTLEADEIWQINDNKIYISSYTSGIIEWDKSSKSYIRRSHRITRDVGDFLSITFYNVDSEMVDILSKFEEMEK